MISGAPIAQATTDAPYPLALLYLCCAFILGVYLTAQSVSATLLLAAAGIVLLIASKTFGRPHLSLLVLACGLGLVLGAWRYTTTAYHNGPNQVAYYSGRSTQITGVVDGEPQPSGLGQNLPLTVESLLIAGRPIAATGRILVHYTGPQTLEYGDRLQLRGTLRLPYSSPGFDYPAYLAEQGIHATLDFPGLQIVAKGQGNPLEHLALGLRDALRRAIKRLLPFSEAALLIGILLGAPTHSLGALTDPFIRVGMIHIVAISGLKVALVAGTATALCRSLPMRIRWGPPLAVLTFYVLVSGATPAGLRSALMWTMALLAVQLGRQTYVWISLALVSAGLTYWHPLLLWDVGFQLSVVGTAGIVTFTPWFEHQLLRLSLAHRLPPALIHSPVAVLIIAVFTLMREALATTLAAQLATIPIVARGFGQIAVIVGPLANTLLLPLLGPIMVIGGVASLLSLLATALASLPVLGGSLSLLATSFAYLVYPLLTLFIAVVRILASPSFAAIPVPAIPGPSLLGIGVLQVLTFVYYILLLLLARRLSVHASHAGPQNASPVGLRHRMPPLLIVGAGLLGVATTMALQRPPPHPILWVTGTGGDPVVLLQTAHSQNVLLDGGPKPAPLQAMLSAHLPFYQRDLTAVLVSEPDRGHLDGLFGLTNLYTTGHAYDPGAIYPSATYAQWRAELRNASVPEHKARTNLRLDLGNDIHIDILTPPALTLDQPIAPTAYRLHIERLTVLLLNREALAIDPATLQADGACLDALILPGRADPSAAANLIQALHPSQIILPSPSNGAAQPTLSLTDLGRLPRGVHTWIAATDQTLSLDPVHSRCP